MMGSSSKYETKKHQEPSCQILLLNGVTKVFIQVQTSKAARAEDRAQKITGGTRALAKISWGTSSPASLIQKPGRASAFSLPPYYWRILLEVVSKAKLNAFGTHSHILPALTPLGSKIFTWNCEICCLTYGDPRPNYNGSNHDPTCKRIQIGGWASIWTFAATILLEQSSSGQDIHYKQTVDCGASKIASAVIHRWCDTTNRLKSLQAMEEK